MEGRASHVSNTRSQRDPWKRTLDLLNQTPGFQGTLLVTRDGLSVLNECPRLRKPEVAAAMGAAMLAASETLATELGIDRKARFQVSAGQHTVLGVGATEDLMVMALLDASTDAADATLHIERAIEAATRETLR